MRDYHARAIWKITSENVQQSRKKNTSNKCCCTTLFLQQTILKLVPNCPSISVHCTANNQQVQSPDPWETCQCTDFSLYLCCTTCCTIRTVRFSLEQRAANPFLDFCVLAWQIWSLSFWKWCSFSFSRVKASSSPTCQMISLHSRCVFLFSQWAIK